MTGMGGSYYTYAALGTARPKVGDVLVCVWDYTANPGVQPSYRASTGRMDFTRTKDAAGNPVIPPLLTAEYGTAGNVSPVSQALTSAPHNETKPIQVEFTPQYAGTYRLQFRTTEGSGYNMHWLNGSLAENYVIAHNFTPPIDIVVDP